MNRAVPAAPRVGAAQIPALQTRIFCGNERQFDDQVSVSAESWVSTVSEPYLAPPRARAVSEVAVVLVNWCGTDHTLSCLASIGLLNGPAPYVIVVENGSPDQSLARLRSAPGIDALIESSKNLGFGGGCNLGIAQARAAGCKYVWLLNNDCNPKPDALAALLESLRSHPKAGAAGSLIFRDLDCTDLVCWGGGNVSFLSGQPRQRKTPGDVNFLTAASMLVRLDALAAIGDFDERFFLYWEDTDLSFRLRRAGWTLEVADASQVRHAISASTVKLGPDLTRYFNNGAYLFFVRHAKLPWVPILANFCFRAAGQARAGNYREMLTLLRVLLRIDKVTPPGPTEKAAVKLHLSWRSGTQPVP
jgi:GT2 family glycosyltransferase